VGPGALAALNSNCFGVPFFYDETRTSKICRAKRQKRKQTRRVSKFHTDASVAAAAAVDNLR
jgi:hypothetical protein